MRIDFLVTIDLLHANHREGVFFSCVFYSNHPPPPNPTPFFFPMDTTPNDYCFFTHMGSFCMQLRYSAAPKGVEDLRTIYIHV